MRIAKELDSYWEKKKELLKGAIQVITIPLRFLLKPWLTAASTATVVGPL